MGTKFVEHIKANDVEDQPANALTVWFNSVTDCMIINQNNDSGDTEQISMYRQQMRELRDLLTLALGITDISPNNLMADGISRAAKVAGDFGKKCKIGSSQWHKWKSVTMFLCQQEIEIRGESLLYECIGKGGTYRLLGNAIGAGKCKDLGDMVAYQDVISGQLFYRTREDFDARMALIVSDADDE